MSDLNIPPFNLEAEEAVLGSILVDPEAYFDASVHIRQAKYFHIVKHQWLWKVFTDLTAKRQPIDLLTVQDRLEKRGQLNELGGAAYLTRLITLTPTAYNAAAYAALVREAAIRRGLISAASDIAKLAYEANTDLNTITTNARAAVDAVLEGAVSDSLQDMREIGSAAWDYVADPLAATRNLLRTGIGAVNHHELGPLDISLGGGFQRDNLVILAGRPGMGKTSLLCQIADNVSEQGGLVFFASKEMSTVQIFLRIAARRARVNLQKFRLQKGYSSAEENELANSRLQAEVNKLTERETLFIDGKKNQSTDELIALVTSKARRLGRPALILLDHVRLMSDVDKKENENKRLGKITWACKQLAGELDTVVIAAAQLNRATEDRNDKRPVLRDLRDSGEIEENADIVLFPYRQNYYEDLPDGIAEINIAKNRDGDAGPGKVAKVAFISEFTSFEPLTQVVQAPLPKPKREPLNYAYN